MSQTGWSLEYIYNLPTDTFFSYIKEFKDLLQGVSTDKIIIEKNSSIDEIQRFVSL